MNDELALLLENLQSENTVTGETFGSGSQESLVELTPEIRETTPVINNARGNRRLTGVADFFAQEEVQAALLAFGRAFSQGDPTAPGNILADAGESMLQARGNLAALRASESGEDISEAGGMFADPNLVAGLQATRQELELAARSMNLDERAFEQRMTEFQQEMELRTRGMDLDERNLGDNMALKWAQLTFDEDAFADNYELAVRDQELREESYQADIEYKRAMTDQVRSQIIGEGTEMSNEFGIRAERFLGILSEQEENIQDQIRGTERIRASLASAGRIAASRELEAARSAALQQGITIPEGSRQDALKQLDEHITALTERLNTIRTDQELLSDVVSLGLINRPTTTGEGAVTQADFSQISSVGDLRNAAPGLYITPGGDRYEVAEDGTIYELVESDD